LADDPYQGITPSDKTIISLLIITLIKTVPWSVTMYDGYIKYMEQKDMAQEHTEYKYRQRPPMTPEEREKAFGPLMDKYDATFERLGKYEEPKK